MKKLFKMLVALFTLYLLIQLAFKLWGEGHKVNYQLKTDDGTFNVEEIYVSNTNNETDSYYFNILHNGETLNFQTYAFFKRSEMIIKDIKYFENVNYKCLLPVFSNNTVVIDIMCFKDNEIKYYNNIKGLDNELDDFVNSLSDLKLVNWEDNKTLENKVGPITVYEENLIDSHFIGVNNYKGIYTLNTSNYNKLLDTKLFQEDIYERDLEIMINQFYVVADYNKKHEFNDFLVVNLLDNRERTIKSNKKISFDSYIQGVVNDSVYIYDNSTKKQYELNIKEEFLLEVGNADTGIKYYNNNEWDYIDISELANKKVLFASNETTSSDSKYYKVDVIGQGKTGYTYYYLKTSKGYDVYRASNRSPEIKTHLFSMKNIDRIKYSHDFLYFVDGDKVKYYNDNYGVRTLFKNEEFNFNKSLKYSVYINK